MRRRVHPPKTETQRGEPAIIPIRAPARLVTLEDPTNAEPTSARDAFVRLRPPEGTSPDAITSWRHDVAKVAIAVRVVAPPRAADVALALTRVNGSERVGTIREEALALAKETGDEDVVAFVRQVLDVVGA